MYRISKIEIVPDDAKTSSTPKSNSKASKDVKKTKSIKDIYKGVLQSVQKKKSGYEFSKYRKNFS